MIPSWSSSLSTALTLLALGNLVMSPQIETLATSIQGSYDRLQINQSQVRSSKRAYQTTKSHLLVQIVSEHNTQIYKRGIRALQYCHWCEAVQMRPCSYRWQCPNNTGGSR